jgi:hypothetical protein
LHGYGFERILMSALSLFLIVVGMILAPLAFHADDKGPVIFFYSFLILIQYVPLSAIYKTLTWLYIYKEGIHIHVPFRPDQFLEWRQITRVRSSLWGRTIVLSDTSGRIKARVYASLKNSHRFIGWFIQERPDLWQPEEGLSFSKSSIISIYFLIGALFEVGIAIFLAPEIDWGFWLMIGFACLSIVTVLGLPQLLMLHGNTLVLRFPFRERVIYAHEISEIQAVYAPMGYNVVRLKDGGKITLMFFSLGVNLLFAFLWYWHAIWTRSKLGESGWTPGSIRVPHRLTTLPLLHPPKEK